MYISFKDKETNNLLVLDNLLKIDNVRSSPYLLNYELEEIINFIKYLDNLFLVKDDDDGIRPAGKPDECFYCRSKIGDLHKITCVMIRRDVEYIVTIDGNKVGKFIDDEPISWDKNRSEFSKNESSLCKNNFLDSIKWLKNKHAKYAQEEIEKLDHELECACFLLEFKFKKAKNWPEKDHRFYFVGASDED